MGKYVSDSERFTIAQLNRRETELKETREQLKKLKAQLRAMSSYISELKDINKKLGAQVNYLVHREIEKISRR